MDEGLPPNLLRTVVEHMDQGVLVVGADNRIVHSNRRLRDLLGVEGDALRVGGDVEALRREMVERGEYARADPVSAAWGRSGSIERHPTVSERQRPDGTILEIRAMPLPDGGVVRTFADITRRRELEDGAREDRERLRLIAENTGDIVVLCDLDGTKRYVSPAVLPMLGFTPLEYGAATIGAHVHPDDAEEVAKTMASLAGGTCDRATCRYRHRTEDGGYRWVEASCQLIREAHDARPTGWVTALRDISARVEAEERTRISEQRLALALASEGDGLWDFDLRTRRITFTGRWLDLLGYGEGRNRPTREEWRALSHPDDVDLVEQALDRHIAGRTPSLDFEYRVRGAGGGYVWNHVRGRVVEWDGDGAPVRLVGTNSDVTARKRADALISHMARHDALTGLANRIPLHERLALEIGALEHGGRFAVLAGDLDRFKAINDSLGHAAGDDLLRAASTRLAALVGDGDLVARLGGDEFAIVLGGRDAPDAIAAADRIIAAMAEPFDLAGRETSVGISLGMATLDRGERDLTGEEVLRRADVALYAAKAAGRNACEPFRAGMDAALLARSALERDLRDAAARGEFALAYQPIFEAGDRAVLGFEALLRWRHPRRGIVQPGDFIHLAEEAGSIVAIGEWAIGEACRQASAWPPGCCVAVNVPAVQFRRPERLVGAVRSALARSGLAPAGLELEITESVLMQDAEAAIACLLRLRGMGVRIALDDFGTGYSSLAYLRRFPFSTIKLDRLFTRDIADPWTASLVRALADLATRVEADVTAEGVETVEEFDGMRAAGCRRFQGFVLGRPMSPERAGELAGVAPGDAVGATSVPALAVA